MNTRTGAALIAFAAITVPGYVASLRVKEADPGLTTEIPMLVMFATGAITMLWPGLPPGCKTPRLFD